VFSVNSFNDGTTQSQDTSFNQSAFQAAFPSFPNNEDSSIDDSGIGLSLMDDHFDPKTFESLGAAASQFPANLTSQ
jgi:hypothetical protein